MEPIEIAQLISSEAMNTKARELKILDLRGLVSFTDFFVLATAASARQAQAMSDRVYLKMKKDLGKIPLSLEGQGSGQWVLMDYGDVIFHIFMPEQRRYYGLDDLWGDAPGIPIPGVKSKGRRGRGQAARKKRSSRPSRTSPSGRRAPRGKSRKGRS
jgi:ribosome-associated protein